MITEQDWVEPAPQPVHITGIHVPFWSVVGFMVKWSIAAIPALIILSIIVIVVEALVAVLVIHFAAPGSFTELLRELISPPAQ